MTVVWVPCCGAPVHQQDRHAIVWQRACWTRVRNREEGGEEQPRLLQWLKRSFRAIIPNKPLTRMQGLAAGEAACEQE
jgi:hypothetical protein